MPFLQYCLRRSFHCEISGLFWQVHGSTTAAGVDRVAGRNRCCETVHRLHLLRLITTRVSTNNARKVDPPLAGDSGVLFSGPFSERTRFRRAINHTPTPTATTPKKTPMTIPAIEAFLPALAPPFEGGPMGETSAMMLDIESPVRLTTGLHAAVMFCTCADRHH